MNMMPRRRFLAAATVALFLATSTLALAQARTPSASRIACLVVNSLKLYCEIDGIAQPLLRVRDEIPAREILHAVALVKAQWIWRVLRDM